MTDWLYGLDRWLFVAINSGLAAGWSDPIWPVITNYDRILPVRIVLAAVWLLLMVRGGARGRTAALLLIPILVCADQLGSFVLKPLFARPRPCHFIDGVRAVEEIRLLVDCGPGRSFPSSHAVNNGALALLFSYYFRRFWPLFAAWALLVAWSRIAVGVHYPSDVAGGLLVGAAVAWAIILMWEFVQERYFPDWSLEPEKTRLLPQEGPAR